MRLQSGENGGKSRKGLAIFSGAILLLLVGGVLYATMREHDEPRRGPRVEQGQRPEGRPGPGGGDGPRDEASREERRAQMLDTMREQADLSEEQVAKIQGIMGQDRPESREEWRERFQAVQEVMTPEQQEKMRNHMQSQMRSRFDRRMEGMRDKMDPAEFEDYKQKAWDRLQQRISERMSRGDGPPPPRPPAGN